MSREELITAHGRADFPWVRPDGTIDYQAYLKSPEWRLKGRAVRRRAAWRCERCHRGSAAEIHHLTYERLGYESLNDLQALCPQCHQFVGGVSSLDPAQATDGPILVADVLREMGFVQ